MLHGACHHRLSSLVVTLRGGFLTSLVLCVELLLLSVGLLLDAEPLNTVLRVLLIVKGLGLVVELAHRLILAVNKVGVEHLLHDGVPLGPSHVADDIAS